LFLLFAGLAVLNGRAWGRWVGVFAAGVAIISGLLWRPVYPVWSILLITLYVFMMIGLVAVGSEDQRHRSGRLSPAWFDAGEGKKEPLTRAAHVLSYAGARGTPTAERQAMAEPVKIAHPSVEERAARGKAARKAVSPSSHAGWEPAADRPDPIALLEEQNARRDPDLVPVRHGRMMVSPFTFYRGAARIMAADLRGTPRAGLTTQLCGDAHLSNFGIFASPERQLVFDLNDFDETLPGPFEYDVARLAASFTIAARNNGFGKADEQSATRAVLRAYREAMAGFAQMRVMDLWYAHLSEQDMFAALRALATEPAPIAKKAAKKGTQATKAKQQAKLAKAQRATEQAGELRIQKAADKARTRDSLQALSKLAEFVDGRYRIVSQPPIIVPAAELFERYGVSAEDVQHAVHQEYRAYRATLQADRRHLLEKFELVDMARKVVGVGSVGTRAFIILLQGRDEQDPLFLQVKEATQSVLEDHLPKSRHQPGSRVVHGQRMMQAASDIFLGWTKGLQEGRFLYWRQLRDMKGSADIESLPPFGLEYYARLCGWTLARAHARSGDPVAIAAYLGKNDKFDVAMTDFSERYADQNERDFEAFLAAIKAGRLEAVEGL
jgi:uncharacterized protein (DUF2252 family)